MNIHQISVRYIGEEDRILVLVNSTDGDELTLWLTRRLMLAFWPLLNQMIAGYAPPLGNPARFPLADDHDKKMMVEFQKAKALEKTDFQTPYSHSPGKPVLGPKPLLVTEIKLKRLTNGLLQLEFFEKVSRQDDVAEPNDEGLELRASHLTLNEHMLHGWVHLLSHALAVSQWGKSGEALLPQPESGTALSNSRDNSKYLN